MGRRRRGAEAISGRERTRAWRQRKTQRRARPPEERTQLEIALKAFDRETLPAFALHNDL
jgi:hypothetical protein